MHSCAGTRPHLPLCGVRRWRSLAPKRGRARATQRADEQPRLLAPAAVLPRCKRHDADHETGPQHAEPS
eukprot:7710771-Pyramimonas_sp.AAC.1